MIGTVALSGRSKNCLRFGPFNQKGTYLLGMTVDGVSGLALQAKIASVDLIVNDSTIQSFDFVLPGNTTGHYAPPVHYFEVN